MSKDTSKFEVMYESNVLSLDKKTGLLVQVQKGGTYPTIIIAEMYSTEDGDYGFKKPAVNGYGKTAVQIRESLEPAEIDWLITELQKAKATVEKAVKAQAKAAEKVEKASTKKPSNTRKTVTLKNEAAVTEDEDQEIILENKRTSRKAVSAKKH